MASAVATTEKTQLQELVEELIEELRQQMGLSLVDARRSAFCALGYAQGWPTARIGRFLGITRARVGQRIDRLVQYARQNQEQVPVLAALIRSAPQRNDAVMTRDLPVAMERAHWEQDAFALGMLQLVTRA